MILKLICVIHMTGLITRDMGELANKDDAGVDQQDDENIIYVDDKIEIQDVPVAELKENKMKNEKLIDDVEIPKENDNINNTTSSKKLRFGIEAILKVQSDVTDQLAKRTSEQFEKHVPKLNDDDNDDGNYYNDDNDDGESGDHLSVDNLYETDDKCFTYVRLPPSLHGMHSPELSLMSPQSALTMGAMTSAWSTSLVNDVRKERFTPIRRIGHPYQNRTPPKRKKPRTSFTRLQILELEKRFERQKYLASTERSTLAKSLKMSDAQVKTWFQNRRTKWRRQTAEERELERQAANRLLFSIQSDPTNRKSMIISGERMCLSHLQRLPESRPTDI